MARFKYQANKKPLVSGFLFAHRGVEFWNNALTCLVYRIGIECQHQLVDQTGLAPASSDVKALLPTVGWPTYYQYALEIRE